MLIRHQADTTDQIMDMPGAAGVTMKLMVGRDDEAPNFAMRLFTVEPGGHTPRHSHNYEHEVFVLEGQGQVVGNIGGSTVRPIQQGDALLVPANEEHQFRNPSDKPFRFICLVPVTFDCGSGACQPTPGSFISP